MKRGASSNVQESLTAKGPKPPRGSKNEACHSLGIWVLRSPLQTLRGY